MLENIEVCSTWQCINSFSSWLSALFSPLIAIFSLWVSLMAYKLAKLSSVPRIDVSMNLSILVVKPEKVVALAINIKNIGSKKVIVGGYSWNYKLPKQMPVNITTFHVQDSVNIHSKQLPMELNEGENAIFYNHPEELLKSGFLNGFSKFKAWYVINTMKFKVSCSTFDYEIRLPKYQRRNLWELFLKNHKK
jgi:hypothetical protein